MAKTRAAQKAKRQGDVADVAEIEAEVQAVLDERWYWFPVRHHSAAVARHLQTAIQERHPKLILIEGPSEANELIPFLANAKTRPPVAIYSCFSDDENRLGLAGIHSASEDVTPRWACWSPFIEYSPELVAIRAARSIRSDVCFIDLPHYGRLAQEAERIIPRSVDEEAQDTETDERSNDRNWQTEKLIAECDFYQSLAAAGGYKSWDEGWDAMFEFHAFADPEAYRREMLTFCCAARRSCAPERIAADGTLERERYMMQSIRREIETRGLSDDDVMIVCGGFHAFLDRDDETPPPELPEGTLYTTLVPYTTFRISDLSGYGAGNRAPQFYQLHWEALIGKLDNPRDRYLVSVLHEARKLGENLSAADAISVSQHARMLAALRRREPILDDLHDALVTCCCKGDPEQHGRKLKEAIDTIDIGNRVGRVIAGAPRLPIVDDFYNSIDDLGLGKLIQRERREKLELDKRKPEDFDTAAFLHRLSFIEVPFCSLEGQPDTEFESGLIFRERWLTKWSPDVEAKLIEKNLLGDSIQSAAVNQLRTMIANSHGNADVICGALVSAMQMNLPSLIDQVFDVAVAAIDEDPRFVSLCRAVSHLTVLDRYALHHEMKRGQIEQMLRRAFARACFSMVDIASAPDDQHPQIVNGLTTLADRVLKGDDEEEQELFSQYVAGTLKETTVPFLKGALLGLTVEIRLEPHQRITEEIVGFAHSPQEQMTQAGDFVHGVISVSRASIMAGASELVEALDELIRSADWEVFIVMLPRLRSAMELLHARHRDSLASRVAELHGLAESRNLQQLDIPVEAAVEIARIDKQVAAIMSKWSLSDD